MSDGMPTSKPKILLVEDDPLSAAALIDLLEFDDFDVTHCEDWEGMLEAIAENHFLAAILDLNLDGVSGTELARSIRQSGFSMPLIFILSANSRAVITREADEVGAAAAFRKPEGIPDLLRALRELSPIAPTASKRGM